MNKKTDKLTLLKKFKTKLLVLGLLFSIGATQPVYAGTFTAGNFLQYTDFLQKEISDYKETITIIYKGNETFLESEIGGQLHLLFNESAKGLSAFDKQNIYSIRMLSAERPIGRRYALQIAQYEMQYKNSAKELEEVDLIINEVLEEIALKSKNEYETLRAIYEYVLDTYSYKKLATDENDAANILLERNILSGLKGTNGVVCDAYVMLLSRMLTASNIENIIVTGTAYDDLHVWNKVKLNDVWYNIDPTWGDSKYVENKEKYFLTSDKVLLLNGHSWVQEDYPVSPHTYNPIALQ